MRILDGGRSVMVAAPTGTGKTVVAEFAIFLAHSQGLRSIYTAPIKALSNQKFRDLRNQYGEDVGLLTGDIVENPKGQILVMTTEVLRNMLVQRPRVLDDVGCVIFDEIHYLADPERGTAWEESIILAPSHVQLVCLSATVSNAQEMADWISAVHRPIDLVFHGERTVPLEQYYFLQNKLHRVIDAHGRRVANFSGVGGEYRKRGIQRGRGGRPAPGPAPRGKGRPGDDLQQETDPVDIVRALQKGSLLPAIYFVFSRKDTERVAAELSFVNLVDNRQRRQVLDRAEEYLAKLEPVDRGLEQVQSLERVLRAGIAFHHAGMLPILKVLVEDLFAEGLLPVVVATDTLAMGVNLPAKTVVIGEMTKFDGESRRLLIPNEYTQMPGRAGRRGLDQRGIAVVPYSPWVGFDEAFAIAQGELHPVRSGFAIRYNTLLNLWNSYGEDQIVALFSNSLREFQVDAHLRALQGELQEIDAEIGEISGGHVSLDEVRQYDYDRKSLHEARKDLRRAEDHLLRVRRRIDDTPFGLDRGEVERLLRSLEPGTPVFLRDGRWAIAVRPGPFLNGVIGLFLIGHQVVELKAYGEVLDIPAVKGGPTGDGEPTPAARRTPHAAPTAVTLPDALLAADGPVDDVRKLVSKGEWAALRKRVLQAERPEVPAQWAAQRQAIDEAYAGELGAAQRQVADVHERIERLQASLQANHVHRCPERKEHEQVLYRLRDLETDRRQVNKELQLVMEEKHTRTREIVENLVGVLVAFGYIRRGALTDKAQVLKDIFASNGLVICEAIDRGLLDQLPPAELVEVISWFAYDRDVSFPNRLDLPSRVWNVRQQLDRLQQQVFRTENDFHTFISTGASPYYFGVTYGWCRGWTFDRLLDAVNLTEGDIVATLNKTLDLMRQVRHALRNSPRGPNLIPKLEEGERLIRRGIVEQCFSALSPTGEYAPVDEAGIDEVPIPETPPRAPQPAPVASQPGRRRTRRIPSDE